MHPDSLLNHIDTLNQDDTIGISALSAAREALKICHEAYGRMNDAEAALTKATPSIAYRRDGQILNDCNVDMINETQAFCVDRKAFVKAAEKAFTRIVPQVDRRVRELDGIKETLSKRVATAIDEPARRTPEGLALAREVRNHVKGLSDKARITFVVRAIESNDKATLGAVLHAQPFLSGLDKTAHGTLRERAAAKFAPVDLAQLAATTAAIEQVTNAVSLLLERYAKLLSSRMCRDVEMVPKPPNIRKR
jgi:hypothetical protein